MEDRDPAWSQAMDAEATRLWSRFFSTGNHSNIQISIPIIWANFFTVLLLNPTTFNWVKQLLSSKIPSYLNSSGNGIIEFSLPTNCPQHNFDCLAVS